MYKDVEDCLHNDILLVNLKYRVVLFKTILKRINFILADVIASKEESSPNVCD